MRWLSTDWILRLFDRKKNQARKEYHRFVSKGLDEEYRKEFHTGNKGGVALGDEAFFIKLPEFGKSRLLQNKPQLELSEINKQVCRIFQTPESFLKTKNRSLLASKLRSFVALIFSEQSGRISQVADYYGKDISTISRQMTNLKRNMLTDNALKKEVDSLKKLLNATTQA